MISISKNDQYKQAPMGGCVKMYPVQIIAGAELSSLWLPFDREQACAARGTYR